MAKKIALITGATSGIGLATARILAENGYRLIVTGRREALLQKIAADLMKMTNVLPLCFDVRDKNGVDQAFNTLASLGSVWQPIDLLINNAGLAAGKEPVHTALLSDWEQMIDTNIKGLLYMTKKVLPEMIARKSGHIINLGSIAGKEAYANGSVYCATKHAVDAFTKALRIDVLPFNIRVTQISPGMVETEFSLVRFKGDLRKAEQVYEGLTPLSAEDIAEAIWFAVNRPAHVNISDIWIMPTAQANTSHIHRENS